MHILLTRIHISTCLYRQYTISYSSHPLPLFLEIDQTQFSRYIPSLARCQLDEIQTSFRDLSMGRIVSYLVLLVSCLSANRLLHVHVQSLG